MDSYLKYLNNLIDKNKQEFADLVPELEFIDYSGSNKAENSRSILLEKLKDNTEWLFQHTKPFINSISEGCRLCGQGEWSCLFITGLCNATCFYCPASQKEDHLPTSQTINFRNATDYAAYLKKYGFKGMSISGGEPFLFPERTLEYIRAAKNAIGNDIYIWMYTNGIASSKKLFHELVIAGLTEVRFDIGATSYSTEYIKNAEGIVPVITVEIPAVPDDVGQVIKVLPELVKLGVKHLNFHQIRLTRHNFERVMKRANTFLHGERVTILESELAALEIMNFVVEKKINIGVNYCAYQYKSRFQKAGYRKKIASAYLLPGEKITQNGFIRTITLDKKPETELLLRNISPPQNGWYEMDGKFLIELFILEQLKEEVSSVELNYWGISLKNSCSDLLGNFQSEIIPIRAKACSSIVVQNSEINEFIKLVQSTPETPPSDPLFFAIWRMEFIESGWRQYF